MTRQSHFLNDVLKEANQNKRQQKLQYANADQINAVSELVMNTLRGSVVEVSNVINDPKCNKGPNCNNVWP